MQNDIFNSPEFSHLPDNIHNQDYYFSPQYSHLSYNIHNKGITKLTSEELNQINKLKDERNKEVKKEFNLSAKQQFFAYFFIFVVFIALICLG